MVYLKGKFPALCLFSKYLLSIGQLIYSYDMNYILYAYDTQLYIPIDL